MPHGKQLLTFTLLAAILNPLPQAAAVTVTMSSDGVQQVTLDDEHEAYIPPDSGVVNVKAFGAFGDGVHDDTAAIISAIDEAYTLIGPYQDGIVYFPAGTYLVSQTLKWQNSSGAWEGHLAFRGDDESTTVIQLKDDLGFTGPVIMTGSAASAGQSNGGGYDGFENFIRDLTVDIGRGNPGAVGIDFMGNNNCGMTNVGIRDYTGLGSVGLSTMRPWVGPCMFRNVTVGGFQYGVETANTEYSMTFNTLTLHNQTVAGVLNNSQALSIVSPMITDAVPAIINKNPYGLVTVYGGYFYGSSASQTAIENYGGLFARDINVTGYGTSISDQSVPGSPRTVTGAITEYHSANTTFGGTSLDLKFIDTPVINSSLTQTWISVAAFGVLPDPTCQHDYTAQLTAALNSPNDVVYFPAGQYCIHNTIPITVGNKQILGFGSHLYIYGTGGAWPSVTTPVFSLAVNGPISFEDFMILSDPAVDFADTSPAVANQANHVILKNLDVRNVGNQAPGYVYQGNSVPDHQLWIENVDGSPYTFSNGERIWAQQFDVEENYNPVKVLSNDSTLWVLGLKTEQPTTVIETTGGGSTEILGGLLYPLAGSTAPAFVVDNGTSSMTYAVSAYSSTADYTTQVQVNNSGQAAAAQTAQMPPRGYGVLVPFVSTTALLTP